MNIEKEAKLFKSSKIYTFCVAFLPVFATYASGVPGFSVADIILALFTFYAMISKRKNENQFSCDITLLFVGVFLILFFDVISFFFPRAQTADIIIRTIRYCFYIICFVYTSRKLVYVDLLVKYVKIISVCATIFLLIQFMFYNLLGVIVRGFISGVKLYTEQYATANYAAYYRMIYRPTSFFLEPAHFARYAALGLTLYLWEDEFSVKEMMLSIFISFGILLSTSSQGYLLVAIIWFLFLVLQVKKIKSNAVKKLIYIAIPAMPLIFMLVLKQPTVQKTILRSLSGGIDNGNSAVGARMGGFLIFNQLPFIKKLFGNGFGSIPKRGWLSSAAYWLYGSGIIVFAVYVLFMVYSMVKVKKAHRIILLVVFALFFSDDSFYSYMIVLFFSLSLLTPYHIYNLTKEKKYEINTLLGN